MQPDLIKVTVPAPDTCSRAGGCPQRVDFDIHRWYVVVKVDGKVIKVVGDTGEGYLAAYDSVEEYRADVW